MLGEIVNVSLFQDIMESKDSEFNEINWGYPGALVSFSLFVCNTRYLLPLIAPQSAKETPQKHWKWRNTVNSLIHSSTTGGGSLLNLWLTPELRGNLISVYSTSSVIINSITVGYFIYDFLDMAINNYKKRTYELLLHHAMVIICFGLALVTRRYQGYAMVALLLEVNSVFLHVRQLFIIHGVSKADLYYKINSYTNIGTFVVFRLLPLSWQMRWLASHKDQVPNAVVILGFVTSTIIMILNLGLLVQILYKDFIKKEQTSKKQE